MTFITIDGDDIGRRITALYLSNDSISLGAFAELIQNKIQKIADMLQAHGFTVIFCAADGVVAHTEALFSETPQLYDLIQSVGGSDLTFSAGVGGTLREAYVALLAAKSNGKSRMVTYEDIA